VTPRNSSLSSDDPRERAFDALDHANEERKERRHDQRTEPLDYIELRQEIRHAFTKEPAMSSHSTRQMIPTLPDVEIPARIVAVELMRLLDALLDAPTGTSLCLHESTAPGAAATMRAWADAHRFTVEDRVHVVDYREPYVSLCLFDRPFLVSVCAYRPATPEEVAAEEARTVKP